MAEAKNNDYFRALTGVRAIAAYMVYIHHFNPFTEKTVGKYVYNFTNELHVGVTLFFVLSGFLIAYRYSELTNFKFKNYMMNRIARIYPMYFLLTSLTFLFYAVLNAQRGLHEMVLYGLNITFLRGFFETFKFTGIAQGWSLTVEETFYILAPIFFILLNRSKAYLLLLPCLAMTTGLLLVLLFSQVNFYGFFSSFEFMFNYTFFGRCFEFFIGIALAVFYKRRSLLKLRFGYFTWGGLFGMLVCIFLLSQFKGNFDFGLRSPYGKVLNTFMLPLIGIAPFYYGLLTEKTIISKLLGSNLFVILGKASYIFYLIHLGIFALVLQMFTANSLIIFIALNIISVVLFKLVEEPLNVYIRSKVTRQVPVGELTLIPQKNTFHKQDDMKNKK